MSSARKKGGVSQGGASRPPTERQLAVQEQPAAVEGKEKKKAKLARLLLLSRPGCSRLRLHSRPLERKRKKKKKVGHPRRRRLAGGSNIPKASSFGTKGEQIAMNSGRRAYGARETVRLFGGERLRRRRTLPLGSASCSAFRREKKKKEGRRRHSPAYVSYGSVSKQARAPIVWILPQGEEEGDEEGKKSGDPHAARTRPRARGYLANREKREEGRKQSHQIGKNVSMVL